jgi:N-acetylglucosaminyl-diphospho-decaprenol L-rhamnosyltransferase
MDIFQDDHSTMISSDQPVFLISIVGFRNADDVVNCLTSLARLSYTNFIVSICENGGDNALRTLVERLQGVVLPVETKLERHDEQIESIWSGVLQGGRQPVHLLQAKSNLGYAGGVNITLRQFAGDPRWSAIWLLNPDTLPEPDALTALAKRARETGAFIVGGRIVRQDTGRIQLYGGRWRKLIARGYNIGRGSPKDAPVNTEEIERVIDYVNGASMYVTRAFVKKIGLMDEDYFLYCEEVDWCMRVDRKFLRYAHDCVVYHQHGTTIGSNSDPRLRSDLSIYLDERNKLLLSRRYYPYIYPVIVMTTLLLLSQFVAKGASGRLGIGFRGWLAGLRGERGAPVFLLESRKDA